jgi:hypothetical protein
MEGPLRWVAEDAGTISGWSEGRCPFPSMPEEGFPGFPSDRHFHRCFLEKPLKIRFEDLFNLL